MQGLTIIVATADPERFRSALEVAATNAALDRPTFMFLQGSAAALMDLGSLSAAGPQHASAGLPTLPEMLTEAIALGARISVCQSGLALAGMEARDLPESVEIAGLVEMLSRGRDHQLLMA
jgi:predicted peroxiredoxin